MVTRAAFDADDTEGALMAATYLALCDHGYADLTIERIGDEFEKSNSLLYHHYGSKDDLLLAFLAHMLERFEEEVPFEGVSDPWERLQRLLDHVLAPSVDEEHREFTRAMMELRAQAATDPDYRAAFTRHDEFFRERLVELLEDGIDRGMFRAVDPDGVAAWIQTTFVGVMLRRATTDPDAEGQFEAIRREFERVLSSHLLGEASTERTGSHD